MSHTSTPAARSAQIRTLTVNGISIALVFIATAFINIRLPVAANGGLIHLGNVPLFLAAAIFGRKTGVICGAFGMALFDLMSGWALWAPFTFIIVGLMGYTVGRVTENKDCSIFRYLIAALLALIIKIIGYYIAEALIYGNWTAPAASIPGNVIQVGFAAVVFLITVKPLRRQLNSIMI